MGWREVLTPEPSDKRDKSPQNDHFKGNSSQNDPFSHYCHHDSGIENDESKDKRSSGIPKAHTVSADTMAVPEKPVEDGIEFVSLLTDTEREQYFSLLESMEEREAGAIIARIHNRTYRQPLQIQQALQDYRRYGYVKIFSTVLGKAVYLAQDERAARCVPEKDIAVFLESDIEAVKNLGKEEAKVLLEARILFGGPIKIEDSAQPRQPLDGKGIARSYYGRPGEL